MNNVVRNNGKFPRLARQAIFRLHLGQKLTDEERGALRTDRLGHILDYERQRGGDWEFELPSNRQVYKRALKAQVGTQGGFLVPEADLLAIFVESHDTVNPWRTFARTATTKFGTDHRQAIVVDAGSEGFEYIEGQNVPAATDPVFCQAVFRPRTFHSGYLRAPYGLIEDQPDLPSKLQETLGRRCGRIERRRWTEEAMAPVQTGLPKVAAGSSDSISAADIENLLAAVHENCQDSPAFCLMMNPILARVLFKLRDGQGQYLFPNGRPLDVRRVLRNPSMPSTIQAGAVTAIAGDFSAVSIVDHETVRFRMLTEGAGAAERDQVDFQAVIRSSMRVIDDNGSTKPLCALQHP